MAETQLTRITAHKPDTLTKNYGLNPAGSLKKTSGGPLSKGTAERLTITGIEDLAAIIKDTRTNQALVYGVSEHETARIITKKVLAQTTGGADIPYIARDRDHFTWPDGGGIMLLDFDGFQADTADEIFNLLAELNPAFKTAPMIIFPSSSSGLYHGEKCLKGLDGWRALVLVADAQDIPRTGDTLFKTAWLQSKGILHISESGAQLVRAPLDGCVWTPERLDFVSGAKCTPPLEQRRPETVLYNKDAAPLDTMKIKSLTPAETLEYDRLVKKEKIITAPAAKEQRERWIENCIQKRLSKKPNATDDDREKIRETFTQAAKRRTLYADFVLHPVDGEPVTVADVLAKRDHWHLQYIRDPLEPFGENSRARLHLLTGGKPYIWSFYSQTRFNLSHTRKKLQIIKGARVETVENILQIAREDGGLFTRAGEIVAVNESAGIMPLDVAALQYLCDGLVSFEKFDGRSGGFVTADCPRSYAEGLNIAAKMNDGLSNLTGIITHPTFDPKSGRIITRDGYDTETGLLLRLDATDWPDIPEKPDQKQVLKAAETIFKPFAAFPFADALDLGVFFAALLTALVRVLLETAPLIMITAPTPGTGKTLLARCLARLIGLNFPAVFPGGGADESEIRKRLLSIFRSGVRLVVMDNLSGTLQSNSLCAALTSTIFEDRILGASEIISAPTNTLFIATGNNIRPAGDLCRRTVICRLDAGTEKPWHRTFDFNIIEYIDRHRTEMVTAALTILKGAYESGFQVSDGLGSFEDWNATTRTAVCYLQEIGFPVDDPALSIENSLNEDPETGKLSAILHAWQKCFTAPASVADAIHTAGNVQTLFDALFEIAGEGRDTINARRLGRWIEKHRGRIIDGNFFEIGSKSGGKNNWQVKN